MNHEMPTQEILPGIREMLERAVGQRALFELIEEEN